MSQPHFIPVNRIDGLSDNAETLFNTIGGIGLGLTIAQTLAKRNLTLTTPPFVTFDKNESLASVKTKLATFQGKRAILKCSHQKGDFTDHSYRGLYSTASVPRRVIKPETTLADLTAYLEATEIADTAAYILQEFVVLPNSAVVLMHGDDTDLLCEIRNGDNIYVYSADRATGHVQTREPVTRGASIQNLERRFDVEKILKIQKAIADSVDFPINTEGFYNNQTYQIVQLRRTPLDAIVNPETNSLSTYPSNHVSTRLVMGAFQAEGCLMSTAMANEHPGGVEPLLVVRADNALPWTQPYFTHRYKQNLETIIIDTVHSTVIGHGPNDIPHDLKMRAYLQRIGAPHSITADDLVGQNAKVKSNGSTGYMCL